MTVLLRVLEAGDKIMPALDRLLAGRMILGDD